MARRKANGEGSIYKRKDGRWEGAVSVTTTSGKPKRVQKIAKHRSRVWILGCAAVNVAVKYSDLELAA